MSTTRTNITAAILIPDPENRRLIMILDDQRIRYMPINQGGAGGGDTAAVCGGGSAAVGGGGSAAVGGGDSAAVGSGGSAAVGSGGSAAVGGGGSAAVGGGGSAAIGGGGSAAVGGRVIYLPLIDDELDWEYWSDTDIDASDDDDDDDEDDYYLPPNQNINMNKYLGG